MCSRAAVGLAVDYGEAVVLPEPRVANGRLVGREVAELRMEVEATQEPRGRSLEMRKMIGREAHDNQ
jgi:hypothetical protein